MKRIMTMAVVLMTAIAASGAEKELASPDGRMTVVVSDDGGKPAYRVSLDGQAFLLPSPLGVKANFDDLTQGLSLGQYEVKTVTDE